MKVCKALICFLSLLWAGTLAGGAKGILILPLP